MKVVLLLQFYFPFGGLQRDCVAMARGLKQNGVSVSIVTRSWEGDSPDSIEVVVLGARGVSNVAMDQNFDHDASAWLLENDYDAVVSFSRLTTPVNFYYAADPCYRVKIQRDRSMLYQRSRKFRYYSELESKIFSKGGQTHLLLLTGMEVPDYQSLYDTESERITILPPSIKRRNLTLAEKISRRENIRKKMGWCEDLQVVIFVGSGFATKGLDRAIKACANSEGELKFCVVGDGKTGKYKKLTRKLGAESRIDFMGARDDAWDLMTAADIMIHPARSENTGTVLVEALSGGTGVLTTDRCGFSNHIVASHAGKVIESPFDQAQLNAELSRLLSESWQERAEQALEYAVTQDLYSGMETAVQSVISYIRSNNNESQ